MVDSEVLWVVDVDYLGVVFMELVGLFGGDVLEGVVYVGVFVYRVFIGCWGFMWVWWWVWLVCVVWCNCSLGVCCC